MARLQDAVHNIEIIANAHKSDTPELDRLQQAVQAGNAASSTLITTSQYQQTTTEAARLNVVFRDPFDVRYINTGNTSAQVDTTTGVPKVQTLTSIPTKLVCSESG